MPEIKPQRYKDERPAEEFARYHEWTRTHKPGWVYELVRIILTPMALGLYRCRAIGTEHVPADGPCILAPNHFSNMDHFFAAVYLRRKVQFLAKSQLFGKSRILTYIFRVGGVFPVRRGHHDEEAFVTARSIFERGGCVLVYAEGGRSRTGGLGEPRPGVGRMALESDVPVIPVAIHGSLGVRKWRKLRFPKVTVQYGGPMRLAPVAEPSREEQKEAAERIFEPVRQMYTALEERGRANVIKSLRQGAADAVAGSSAPHTQPR